MAPLSKGAADKLPKAIYWRGILGTAYEFAGTLSKFVTPYRESLHR